MCSRLHICCTDRSYVIDIVLCMPRFFVQKTRYRHRIHAPRAQITDDVVEIVELRADAIQQHLLALVVVGQILVRCQKPFQQHGTFLRVTSARHVGCENPYS